MKTMLSFRDKLGPYEIQGLLGAGGMGEVYRARDPRIGREVAIKVLPSSYSKDPNRLMRFQQEARAAGVLNHPNILAIYDVGSENDVAYLVSELLEGETLRKKIATSSLSKRKAIDYALQTIKGLAAAHEKGIIHRDLKPENLLITTDGRLKILDFGLAKLIEAVPDPEQSKLETENVLSQPGTVLGTVGYMSPEQVRGLPAVRSISEGKFLSGEIPVPATPLNLGQSEADSMETMRKSVTNVRCLNIIHSSYIRIYYKCRCVYY